MTLLKKLNDFFKDKENLRATQIAFSILVVMQFLYQQRAGLTTLLLGGTILGILLIVVGGILILIPEPATTVTGIIMVIVGFILSGGSIFVMLNSISDSTGLPTSIIALIIMGLFVYIKFFRNRQTYYGGYY